MNTFVKLRLSEFLKNVVRYLVYLLVVLILAGVGLWKVGRSTSFQLFGDLLNRVDTQEKIVALTFDD
jgi:peptidoglycan-N-acetylglucosamine deacetylase